MANKFGNPEAGDIAGGNTIKIYRNNSSIADLVSRKAQILQIPNNEKIHTPEAGDIYNGISGGTSGGYYRLVNHGPPYYQPLALSLAYGEPHDVLKMLPDPGGSGTTNQALITHGYGRRSLSTKGHLYKLELNDAGELIIWRYEMYYHRYKPMRGFFIFQGHTKSQSFIAYYMRLDSRGFIEFGQILSDGQWCPYRRTAQQTEGAWTLEKDPYWPMDILLIKTNATPLQVIRYNYDSQDAWGTTGDYPCIS